MANQILLKSALMLLTQSIPTANLSRSLVDGDVTVYENHAALPRFSQTPIGAATPQATAPAPTQIDVDADVIAGTPTELIDRDQWYPGWHATIDGKRTTVQESPFVFRTVQWQPTATGRAHVEFKFEPATTFAGIYFLCLGWSIAAGLFVFAAKRRSDTPA